MKNRDIAFIVGVVIVCVAGAEVWAGNPSYTITDLGVAGTSHYSLASAVNSQGQVVGWCYDDGASNIRASLWTPQGGMIYLDQPGYTSKATDINDEGLVVGYVVTPAGQRAALWQGGTRTDLCAGGAESINNRGQISGTFGLWDGGIVTPTGLEYTRINDLGQIAGFGLDQYYHRHPYLWQNGVATAIGTPFECSSWFDLSLNDAGQVGGWRYAPSGSPQSVACVWQNGIETDYPPTDGYQSAVRAINDQGDVIGMSTLLGVPNGVVAVKWKNGTPLRLLDLIPQGLGWTYLEVTDMNDSGQIVGQGLHDGLRRAFIMTPVPEPATLGLLAVGGLALLRRRRK